MIFNTTCQNEEYLNYCKATIGKPYSLIQKLKMRGVGSSRLIIANTSQGLNSKKAQYSDLKYGNIELRPKGVLVHFNRRLERFSWCIPYHKLVLYNANYFSIHADGNFINFLKNKNYLENKKFISKMTDYKNNYLNLEYYDG